MLDPANLRASFVAQIKTIRRLPANFGGCVARRPNIPSGRAKTVGGYSSYRTGKRGRRFAQEMENRKLVCHVFDLHVVGDDVAIKPQRQVGVQLGLGIEEKRFVILFPKKNVGAQFSLSVKNRCLDRRASARLGEVVT